MTAHVESISRASAVAAPPSSPPRTSCSEQSHDALVEALLTWRSLPVDDNWPHASALHKLRRRPRCRASLMRRVEIVDGRYRAVAA